MRAAVFFAKLLRKFFCPEYLELLNLPLPVGAHPEALSREPPASHGRVQTATGRAPTGGGNGGKEDGDGGASVDVLHNPAACRILRRAEVGALRGGA